MNKRVLVVEDEQSIRQFVVINLLRAGYDAVEAGDGIEALKKFDEHGGDFHVILLDVMMPGTDGLEVCRTIREKNNSVGIIMLTAKSEEIDKINGFTTGADDYITKPFSPMELIVRIDALCRRMEGVPKQSAEGNANEILLGDFTLNLRQRTLLKSGKLIELTQVEFQILECLFLSPDVPVSRGEILKQVWGDGYHGEIKIVDVNMRRLRMKVEDDPSVPRHLMTAWGKGYKWVT